MKIHILTYTLLQTILVFLFTDNCVAQYSIDTLKINELDYTDSVFDAMKNSKINAVVESTERSLYFKFINSTTQFTDIHFFKVVGNCLAVVSDKNYMKPNNEIELYSLMGDSAISISNIDSVVSVVEISNKNYHLLFIEIYVAEFGEKSIYCDIIIVNKETCAIHIDGFLEEFLVPINDEMKVLRNCSIELYVKDSKLYFDYDCLKHEKLGRIKRTYIFSEKEGKFILYNP